MSGVITDDHDDELARIRAILGEHFTNFAYVVLDDQGNLYYDYTNFRVGRMLFQEAQLDMVANIDLDIDWESPSPIEEEQDEE
tara:strand:+ start:649 stop:897 length:249 start_codon:yes stop_codon:yes gene_type:complete